MSFCNTRFDKIKKVNNQLDILAFGKVEANQVKEADFKYLLFNHHTQRYEVKLAKESRLLNLL